ncbi:MAG: hypothetical protein IPG69_08355 [Flavobacteriales bacterium]|nr:hypothetical protein [Flavobacteriales bacterium]
MRKFYTSAFALMLLGGSASAQTTTAGSGHIPAKRQAQNSVHRSHPTATSNVDRVVIWSDDFSVPSTWTTAIEPGAFPLGWQIGVGLENTGSYPTDPIESTTAANGCAMFDSDGGNNPGTLPEALPHHDVAHRPERLPQRGARVREPIPTLRSEPLLRCGEHRRHLPGA